MAEGQESSSHILPQKEVPSRPTELGFAELDVPEGAVSSLFRNAFLQRIEEGKPMDSAAMEKAREQLKIYTDKFLKSTCNRAATELTDDELWALATRTRAIVGKSDYDPNKLLSRKNADAEYRNNALTDEEKELFKQGVANWLESDWQPIKDGVNNSRTGFGSERNDVNTAVAKEDIIEHILLAQGIVPFKSDEEVRLLVDRGRKV